MKSTKYISLAAIALMGALSGCHHDDDEGGGMRHSDVVGVRIAVGSSGATRSNPLSIIPAEQKSFSPGDQVTIGTNDQTAIKYELQDDGETWKEAETNKFLRWTDDLLTFSAFYPTTAGTSMTSFTLPADQSNLSDASRIADADYMTKSLVIARPEGGSDIDIELERQTARVIIKITGFNNQYADADKHVSNVRIHSAASTIADGAASGDAIAVTPAATGDGKQGSTYTALVIPTEAIESASFVTMTDCESHERIVRGIPAMEPGKSYTYNLVVGKDKIEIASVIVQNWSTGATLSGGEAELLMTKIKASRNNYANTDNPIEVNWKKGDKVVVYRGSARCGALYAQSDGQETVLAGELGVVFAAGDVLTLKYQDDTKYDTQDGTLDYILANCDYATANVTVKTAISSAVTAIEEDKADFVNQQAIYKIYINKESSGDLFAKSLTVNGTTATVSTEANSFYTAVAIDEPLSDITVVATTQHEWEYVGNISIGEMSNGNYYEYATDNMQARLIVYYSGGNGTSIMNEFNGSSYPNPTLRTDVNLNRIDITRKDGVVDLNTKTISLLEIQNNTKDVAVTVKNGTISNEIDGQPGTGNFYGTIICENLNCKNLWADGHYIVINSGKYDLLRNGNYNDNYPNTIVINDGSIGSFSRYGEQVVTFILNGGKYKTDPTSYASSGISVQLGEGKSVQSSGDSNYPYEVK